MGFKIVTTNAGELPKEESHIYIGRSPLNDYFLVSFPDSERFVGENTYDKKHRNLFGYNEGWFNRLVKQIEALKKSENFYFAIPDDDVFQCFNRLTNRNNQLNEA